MKPKKRTKKDLFLENNNTLEILRTRTIMKLDDDSALSHIGILIDKSDEKNFTRGIDRAFHLIEEFSKRNLSEKNRTILEYFRANAWASRERISDDRNPWNWENPEREQQILALSRASTSPGFIEINAIRRCQILTNRANQLSEMGRFVDAIEGWDSALRIIPNFAIAQVNRSYCLRHYCRFLEDDRERAIMLLHAYDGLSSSISDDAVYDSIDPSKLSKVFSEEAKEYALAIDVDRVRILQNSNMPSLGRSKAERKYREWCLHLRLFLNPLNDLGNHRRSACDNLALPSISESLDERPNSTTPPPVISFFNQMKQEYASARFLLYEGLHDTNTHFSDRDVRIFDTLDYPMHSLSTERVRTAYRIAYSLLDKTAFLINHYWGLGKIADRINFKNVWMAEGKKQILERFKNHQNWPLRGLFWLSKELFDDQLKQTTGPDARALHDIRNALEHKFLQVHEGWAKPFMNSAPSSEGLGISIYSDLLESKAIRVMKIARSALIQLAIAISVEEQKRAREQHETLFGPMLLFDLEDDRKRRDPM